MERQLYQLLPDSNLAVEANDVVSVLPKDGALIEFQLYETFDGFKNLSALGKRVI